MADTLHARLLARTDHLSDVHRALRAVVELHAPVLLLDLPTCPVCAPIVVDLIGDDGTWTELFRPRPWPCSTIQGIADALGVTDQERIEKEERRG